MNFSIRRAVLAEVLSTAASVVPTKTTMPILQNVLLRADKGHVTIAATDLQLTTWASVHAEVSKVGALTVDAKRLHDIIDGMSCEDVTLAAVESNSYCEVTGGRAKYKAVALRADDFPKLPDAPKGWQQVGPLPFKLLIERTRYAIDQLSQIEASRGALLESSGAGTRMVCLSRAGLAMAEAIIGLSDVPAGTVIPARALKEFVNLSSEAPELSVGFTDRYVYLQRGAIVLGAMTTGLPFPPWEKVVPKKGSHNSSVIVDVPEFRAALSNVATFTEEGIGKGCRFDVDGSELHLRAASMRFGEGHEILTCEATGKPIGLSLVPKQVADTAAAAGTSRVELRGYPTPNSPVSIHPVGSEDFLGLVMPIVEA